MMVPHGFPTSKPKQVCKLQKSLYGLKQASRRWFERLSALLLNCGYIQAPSDHSLFVKAGSSSFTVIIVYVDDIVLMGTSLDEFTCLKCTLHEAFGIKDLGVLKFFLGLEATHSLHGISLCQRQYCLNLLANSGLLGCKPIGTQLEPGTHLLQDDSGSYPDIPAYRCLVGCLLYLTTTRPDISFATQQLSQFLSSPTMTHFQSAQRVLKYLKGSPGKGIMFSRSSC